MELMIAAPIFRSRLARDVGIPVAFEKSRFILVIPTARFHEKLNPGSFIVILFKFLSLNLRFSS